MLLPGSIRRRVPLLAVAAGFLVYGSALGGLATVDDDLRAVAPLETSTTDVVRVSDTTGRGGECEREERGRDLGLEL